MELIETVFKHDFERIYRGLMTLKTFKHYPDQASTIAFILDRTYNKFGREEYDAFVNAVLELIKSPEVDDHGVSVFLVYQFDELTLDDTQFRCIHRKHWDLSIDLNSPKYEDKFSPISTKVLDSINRVPVWYKQMRHNYKMYLKTKAEAEKANMSSIKESIQHKEHAPVEEIEHATGIVRVQYHGEDVKEMMTRMTKLKNATEDDQDQSMNFLICVSKEYENSWIAKKRRFMAWPVKLEAETE
jgi:hypothetical protein